MSPFREQPQVELGPLDVGLEAVAARAVLNVPRGGRLILPVCAQRPSYTTGALGSAGVLGVLLLGLAGASTSWRPQTGFDLVLCVAMVALGGISLATVFRVTDRFAVQPARRGEIVGRAARRAMMRIARLAGAAQRSPGTFGARQTSQLRRGLASISDPSLARWVPHDLRGRAELLLARTVARQAGPAWASDLAIHGEVRELLEHAATHLDDPEPAQADLALLERAPTSARHRIADAPQPARVRARADVDDEADREAVMALAPRRVRV